VGSRLITLVAGLSSMAILPLLVVSQTPVTLCGALFLFGIATGAMNVAMNAQAVEIEIASKSQILSGIHCWFSIGGLLGAVSVSSFLELGFSYFYSVLPISAIVSLILMTQSRHLLPYTPSIKRVEDFCFSNRQVLFLGALCFIGFMTEGAMLDWSAEFLHSNLNYATSTAGMGYGLFSIAMAVGRFIGDSVIKRFGSTCVFQAGSFIAALGILLVVNGLYEWIGFCIIGLGASNVVPILFSNSGKIPAVSPSSALTVVTTCGYLGLLFGPVLIGHVASLTTLPIALSMIALFLIAISLAGRALPSEQNATVF